MPKHTLHLFEERIGWSWEISMEMVVLVVSLLLIISTAGLFRLAAVLQERK